MEEEEEDEVSEEDDDDNEEGKNKKVKAVPKKASESKRAGLRGPMNGNGKEVESRAAVKGLGAPRALKKGKVEEISDVEDDDGEDQMDED